MISLVALILAIMFGPPLLFIIIGFRLRFKKKKDQAKIFFIAAGVYLVISLGSCGAMISG